MESRNPYLNQAVLACFFAALISVGAYMAIPIPGTPVPIVLQNMFIMLAALTLGPWWGLLSVAIYLFFGLAGMPVFSGGTGGLARFLGPTGGYLLGYVPATIAMGFIGGKKPKKLPASLAACVAGMAIVYAVGVARLKFVLDIPWERALASGLYPFLPGDAAKIVLTALLAPRIAAGIESLETRYTDG